MEIQRGKRCCTFCRIFLHCGWFLACNKTENGNIKAVPHLCCGIQHFSSSAATRTFEHMHGDAGGLCIGRRTRVVALVSYSGILDGEDAGLEPIRRDRHSLLRIIIHHPLLVVPAQTKTHNLNNAPVGVGGLFPCSWQPLSGSNH